LREAAGRFVLPPAADSDIHPDSIVFKACLLMADCKVEGDYFEFGVYRGESFVQAYKSAAAAFSIFSSEAVHPASDCEERRLIWSRMRFVAFDSFAGLPELQGVDRDSRVFAPGLFACTEDQFLDNITARGVARERVITVPGWYSESCTPATAARLGARKAAIVMIDCDLYESTKEVLSFLGPLLQDGTVLIFDDWFHFSGSPYRGEQRAFREWTARLPGFTFSEYQKDSAWRNSFIASVVRA
jgi:O-methyltransferase